MWRHSAGAIGDGLRRIGTEELDALHRQVAVVLGIGVAVVGRLDHHGIEAALLHLEVLVELPACCRRVEYQGIDQLTTAIKLHHPALQLATKHLAELDIGAIGDLARIQLDDQLLGGRGAIRKVTEVDLVGDVVIGRRAAGYPQTRSGAVDTRPNQL
ncbi:hypothetical protein D3C85_1253160 [compost metagenome]